MEKNFKISVITVTKNSEKFLEENLKSLENQIYKNFEHIIIDGKSNDRTLEIINQYKDKIYYWKSEKDLGLYDAMNKGISVATGEII